MKVETLSICGMVCRPCEAAVTSGLLSLPGIVSVKPDYLHAHIDLAYDESICTREEIEERLAEIGYPPGRPVSGALYDLITLACVIALFFALQLLPHAPLANRGMTAAGLFILGLGTSVHCLAMCGGLMLTQTMCTALPFEQNGDRTGGSLPDRSKSDGIARRAFFGKGGSWDGIKGAFARSTAYNGARFLSCTLTGAILGGLGTIFVYPIWLKGALLTAAGAFVVLFGLSLSGIISPIGKIFPLKTFFPTASETTSARSRSGGPPFQASGKRKPLGAIVVGALNGFMPCGALVAAWLVAASSGSALSGAVSMMVFCAGTLPLMIAFGGAAHLIPSNYMKYALHGSAIIATALGLSLALAGLRMF